MKPEQPEYLLLSETQSTPKETVIEVRRVEVIGPCRVEGRHWEVGTSELLI